MNLNAPVATPPPPLLHDLGVQTPAGHPHRTGRVDDWLNHHLEPVALAVIAAAFILRLSAATGTYLNPDEALQYAQFNQASLRLAYQAGLSLPHPPLYYVLLYYWHLLGRSEFMLRLPSVLFGTAFCWISFKWIGQLFGRASALTGLALVSFCPSLIALSGEVRQYALLLLCMVSALHFLGQAFEQQSVSKMWRFSAFLYLAILSHYSAAFFVVAAGLYSLARIAQTRASRQFVAAWLLGQIGALAIYVSLYLTHLAKLRKNVSAWGGDLDKFYFHSYRDDILVFTARHTFAFFHYLFAQSYVAAALLVFFVAGVAILFARDLFSPSGKPSSRLGILLFFPLVALWLAALAGIYPFAPSRHTVFLVPFVIAVSSFLLATLCRQKLWAGFLVALILMAAGNLYGLPTETLLPKANQRRPLMIAAVDDMRRSISQGDLIFVDYQSSLPLAYYLCGPREIIALDRSHADFYRFSCAGYSIVSVRFWKLRAEGFALPFQEMARGFGLAPSDRVWVFQAGWAGNLVAKLPELSPQFQCLSPRLFGDNISIIPFVVGPDLMPASPQSTCGR
jgi:dolichyl-phosphate-mannose-protein mannosyltransferase